jgi:hypothetical protein
MNSRAEPMKIAALVVCLTLFLPSLSAYVDAATPAASTRVSNDLNAAVLPPQFNMTSTSNSLSSTYPTTTLYNGTIVSPSSDPSLFSRPYEGGYQTGAHSSLGVATAVEAEITFVNTNPSSIPSGNWLEGTIALQGEDNTYNGLDYLARAAHVLYPNGVHGVVADFWKDCEGLSGSNCGGTSATELTAFILDIYGLSASQSIYVRITDSNNVLYWYYSYNGNTWYQYYSYQPPSTFKQVFYLGTVGIIQPPYFTAYFYQFGIWAQTAFSCKLCFEVQINNPSYYQSGGWNTVQSAETMSGPYTYFDEEWTLSNTAFTGVCYTTNAPSPYVDFIAGTSCRQANNVVLWG